MSNKTLGANLSDDELFFLWKEGWDSAASIAEDAIRTLLQGSSKNYDNLTIQIPIERIRWLQEKMDDGLYRKMRVSSRGGLDYFFAELNPRSLLDRTILKTRKATGQDIR